MDIKGWGKSNKIHLITCFAMFVFVFFLYFPFLKLGFIADDFIILDFLNNYEGSFWSFLSPSSSFSDPVTESRYSPVYIYQYAIQKFFFGSNSTPYHFISLLYHFAIGIVTYLFTWKLVKVREIAVAAGFLYLGMRLNSQSVFWMACGARQLMNLFGILSLYFFTFGRRTISIILCLMFFSLGMLTYSDIVVYIPLMLLSSIFLRKEKISFPSKRDTFLLLFVVLISTVVLFINFNGVFIDGIKNPFTLFPMRAVFFEYLINLAVPFDIIVGWKLSILFVFGLLSFIFIDRKIVFLLGTIFFCALFWSFFTKWPLGPRHYQVGTVVGAILVSLIFYRLYILFYEHNARLVKILFTSSISLLVLCNVYSIRSFDYNHYDYLAHEGDLLMKAFNETEKPRKIFFFPRIHLPEKDLKFFSSRLSFVSENDVTESTPVLRSNFLSYEKKLGIIFFDKERGYFWDRIDGYYWYLPWYIYLNKKQLNI